MENYDTIINSLSGVKFDESELLTMEFSGFGMKNSHVYRSMLERFFDEDKLPEKCQILLFTLLSLVKNKARVMSELKGRLLQNTSSARVYDFMNKRTTQYNTEIRDNTKIPCVVIPGCNPTLTLMCYSMVTSNLTADIILRHQVTGQLKLDYVTQQKHKDFEKEFWTKQVSKTKNPNPSVFRADFVEEFYNNKAVDTYPLYDPVKKSIFKEERYNATGYSHTDLEEYTTLIKKFVKDRKPVPSTLESD